MRVSRYNHLEDYPVGFLIAGKLGARCIVVDLFSRNTTIGLCYTIEICIMEGGIES